MRISKNSTLLFVWTFCIFNAAVAQDDMSFRWGPEVLISDESNSATLTAMIGYAIAVSGDNVHAVWTSAVSQTNQDLYYNRSDDGGVTWNGAQRITQVEVVTGEAVIAVHGQNVFVAWRDSRYFEEGSIFFKRSTDNGNTWSNDFLLSPDNVRSAAPTMAVDGDTIYVAWEHYDLGCGNTRLRRSADAGATWGEPLDATRDDQTLGGGGGPSLTIGKNHSVNLVHVSLKDAGATQNYNWEIYFKSSFDDGNTWTDDVRLTDDQIGDSRFPTSAAFKNTLHVVWWDDRDDTMYTHYGYPPIKPEPDHNFEVYYKRSTDNGISWSDDIRLTNAESYAQSPSVVAFRENVYVVWQDFRDGADEIYFKYSLDNGTNWSQDIRLTDTRATSEFPSLAADDSGNVYIIWTDKRSGSLETYFRKGEYQSPALIRWQKSSQPKEYSLTQNYPNPFNQSTAISYQLPSLSHVELSIYNVAGQRVATLVSGQQPAGKYKVLWNANRLSSGVYLYRIEAGEFQQSKKLTVMK